MELYLLVFKKPFKVSKMSEQIVALKTASKGKGKTNALAGLLNAGKIDVKDNKEFVKKLLEMTKKGEIELDKNGSLKLKNTQIKEDEIDQSALLNIKSLLSQVKLNDKLAIEKSVKELRDNAAKHSEDDKKHEKSALKKLLESAKDGGVEVKKLSVEKLDSKTAKEFEAKETAEAKKTESSKIKQSDKKQIQAELKTDNQLQTEQKNKKELPKEDKQALQKTETPSLATLLQGNLKQKDNADSADKSITQKNKEIKEGKKEGEKLSSKTENALAAAFKELSPEAKKEKSDIENEGFSFKKDIPKDEPVNKKEQVSSAFLEAPKQNDNDLKGKMAVANEALKNFSSDIKETIDNYRPPLMKVSMELNPQNLGAVDVTLISRGQNLIVNVTSSQDTMQMFMQNINEFRQNLMAQGFVSLQMNFNFSDQNKEQNNKNWQKEAAKKYQINNDEMGKIESLDIIVPHPKYA